MINVRIVCRSARVGRYASEPGGTGSLEIEEEGLPNLGLVRAIKIHPGWPQPLQYIPFSNTVRCCGLGKRWKTGTGNGLHILEVCLSNKTRNGDRCYKHLSVTIRTKTPSRKRNVCSKCLPFKGLFPDIFWTYFSFWAQKKRPARRRFYDFFASRLFQDFEQFHLKNQGHACFDGASGGGLVSVGQIRRDVQDVFGTFAHQLQTFGPTFDHLVQAKGGRLATVNGRVEHGTVKQGAFVGALLLAKGR